jgi:probable HAF family extracellular repeat protein
VRALAVIGLSLLSIVGAATRADAGALYTVTEIPFLPTSSGTSYDNVAATAINNLGQVIGSQNGNDGFSGGPQIDVQQPFIYSGGQITKLGPAYGSATGLNDSGQVVGTTNMNGNLNASLFSNGQIAPIAGSTTTPQAINNQGVVVGATGLAGSNGQAFVQNGSQKLILQSGTFTNGTAVGVNSSGQVIADLTDPNLSTRQAFLYNGKTLQNLGTLNGGSTWANAINASGIVVGFSWATGGIEHAFFWQNGVMHDLGGLPGSSGGGAAEAINAAGTIVGGSGGHAFSYQGGVMTDLNSLISGDVAKSLINAVGVNDLGQILVTGTDAKGLRASFVLTPAGVTPPISPVLADPNVVPEPTTLALFGLAGLVVWARKSRRA